MSNETLSQTKEALSFFAYNFLELAILFIGISFLVEVINLYINPRKVQKILSSNKGGYLIASTMGSVTPFCSCSSIPLTLGLIKAKASFGPVMTFLFTSPLLNPIIIVVFWSAFGFEITIVYAMIAFFVSILAGYTLEKLGFEKYIKKELFDEVPQTTSMTLKPIQNNTTCCCTTSKMQTFSITKPNITNKIEEVKKQSILERITDKTLLKKTWKQFLGFAPYIALGIGIGAFVHGFVPQEILAKYASADNPLAVPISAIVGVPLYIRADAMVGLAPALLDKGVSMGSILALTIAGAGASLPEMIMLKKIFKAPIMIFFIISVFTMAIGCGFLVNLFF